MSGNNQPVGPAFGIRHLEYYIPSTRLPIDDLVAQVSEEVIPPNHDSKEDYREFVSSIFELDSVCVEEEHNDFEMISQLLEGLFAQEIVSPSEIGLIVTTTEFRPDTRRNLGQYLQNRFKMKSSRTLNLSGNHCANLELACRYAGVIADTMTGVENILVLHAINTEKPNDRIIGNFGILGDGAGMLLHSRHNVKYELLDVAFYNNGMLHAADMNQDYSIFHLKYISQTVRLLLKNNDLSPAAISKIIIPCVNPLLFTNVLVGLGFQAADIYTEKISSHGHLDSIDFVINLKEIEQSQQLNPGDLLITISMGWAGSYVASLLKY